MYRAAIFFVYLYLYTASAIPDDARRKCFGVHHGMMRCCYGMTTLDITQRNEIRECFETMKPGPPPPDPCEIESCIGQKFGYYGDHGLDKEAFASFVAKKFEINKDLVAAVNENCVNSDISKHGPPDMCDIMKMQHCFDNQIFKTCPDWSNEGECKGFEEAVSECFADY